MKEKLKGICGEAVIEVMVAPSIDGHDEIQRYHHISIEFVGKKAGKVEINLTNFKDGFGRTIADHIDDVALMAIIAEHDEEENRRIESERYDSMLDNGIL